jgi:hypothetical protein
MWGALKVELVLESFALLDDSVLAAVRRHADVLTHRRLPERTHPEDDSPDNDATNPYDQQDCSDGVYVQATCGSRDGEIQDRPDNNQDDPEPD